MKTNDHYTAPAQVLHWSMAAIIVVAWAIGYYASTLVYGIDASKGSTITLHKSIATITLFLIVVRILWRMLNRPPEAPGLSPIMRLAAHGGHILLYVLMLALPVSGWGYSSAAGYEIPVAGLFHIPPLVAKDAGLQKLFSGAHFWLAWSIATLVLGHIGFALKHHLMDKDRTMYSMLPPRR